MAKHTPGPWEMEMDSNADYIVRNKQEFAQLQHENKRLREALEEARLILETLPVISIDTRFIDEALKEGGGSDEKICNEKTWHGRAR